MDRYIQELAEAAATDKVKQILEKFSMNETHEVNQNGLVNEFQHKDFVEMITFLKTTGDKFPPLVAALNKKKTQPTKGPVASDICEFLEQLRPIECQACNNEYLPVSHENSSENKVTCQICTKYSHKACYDQSIVNPEIGIYYVCIHCNINFKQFKVPNVDSENDGEPIAPQEEAKEENTDHTAETCPLLLEARCPFGLKGDGCSFFHPKSCYYYSKFGTDPIDGCRRGKRCRNVHPKLCPNSESLRICLNDECKLVHLRGTQRRKPRHQDSNVQQNSRYYDGNTQQNFRYQENTQPNSGIRTTVPPWENRQQSPQTLPPNATNHQQVHPTMTESTTNLQSKPKEASGDLQNMKTFLENCLDRMKADISKQIELQIDNKMNSFANKPVYQQPPAQWYHPSMDQPSRKLQTQSQPEKQQKSSSNPPPPPPPVSFMGYPMIIPQV